MIYLSSFHQLNSFKFNWITIVVDLRAVVKRFTCYRATSHVHVRPVAMAAILSSCPMTSRPVCPSVRRNLFVRGQIIDWISFWRFGRGGPTRIYGPANVTDADRQIYRLQSRAIRCLFVSRFTWIGRPISCQLQLPFRTFAERNQPALEKKIKTCRSSPTPWAAHPSAIKSPAPSTPSTKKNEIYFSPACSHDTDIIKLPKCQNTADPWKYSGPILPSASASLGAVLTPTNTFSELIRDIWFLKIHTAAAGLEWMEQHFF